MGKGVGKVEREVAAMAEGKEAKAGTQLQKRKTYSAVYPI